MSAINKHALRGFCVAQPPTAWSMPTRRCGLRAGATTPVRVTTEGSVRVRKPNVNGSFYHGIIFKCSNMLVSKKVLCLGRRNLGLGKCAKSITGRARTQEGRVPLFVCQVASNGDSGSGDDSIIDVKRELETNSETDVMSLMQGITGTLQRKLDSMSSKLKDAVVARNALEVRLSVPPSPQIFKL